MKTPIQPFSQRLNVLHPTDMPEFFIAFLYLTTRTIDLEHEVRPKAVEHIFESKRVRVRPCRQNFDAMLPETVTQTYYLIDYIWKIEPKK